MTASAQTIRIDANAASQSIAANIEYYEDSSELLTIEDILAPNFDVNFISQRRDIVHFGLTSSAYWLRFNLDWSALDDSATRILELGPPKLVSDLIRGGIQVYVLDGNRNVTNQFILGDKTSPREIKTLNRGFALSIDPSFGNNIVLRITSARPLQLPLTIWQSDSFRAAEVSANGALNLQYGILLALLLYNLSLFFSIRENSYLFYVTTIAVQALFLFLDSKHFRYLLDEIYRASWYVDMLEREIYPLLVITALLFQRSLLRIWESNLKLDRFLKIILASFGLVMLLALAPNEKVFQYPFIFLVMIAIPLAFYNNLDAIRRGNVTAAVHMAAMSVFLIGTIIMMLEQLWPDFPNNAFTGNAYNVGLILQALLLSLSLSFRYNQIKQEKEDAQLQAITNLVRSEQIKDDLLANVTHELRTPLYGINGLAETALAEFRNDNQNIGSLLKIWSSFRQVAIA